MAGRHCLRVLGLIISGILLGWSGTAVAQEIGPGDVCTTAGHFARSGGPEVTGGGHFLVCDGSNWISIIDYLDGGTISFQVENDTGSCTTAKTGRLRYDGSSTWEYCNGTTWTDLSTGGGGGGGLWSDSGSGYIEYSSSLGAVLIGGQTGLAAPLMP